MSELPPIDEPFHLDLGDDHWLRFSQYEGERAGATVWHRRPDRNKCAGWVAFEYCAWAKSFDGVGNPIATWKVEAEEPLTLSPSVLCRACGDHGFVRGGKWMRA